MVIETIKRSFKRGGKFILKLASALDASPAAMLYAEIRELQREVMDLQQQVERSPQRQQNAA